MPPPCVFGCNNFERLHTFPDPNKYPDRFKLWIELAGIKVDPSEDITVYRKKRVCSNHFTEEHRTRNNRLSAIAIPTLNLKKKASPSNTIPSYMPIVSYKDSKEERVKRLLNVYKDTVKNLVGSPYSSDQSLKTDPSTLIQNENDEKRPASPTLKVKTCNKVYARRKSLTYERKSITKAVVQSVSSQEPITPKHEKDNNPEEVQVVDKCIICEHSITQSHYVCVECAEFSMCEPCALTCEHNQHYMLRIPNRKPQSEVKAVLERLQKQLLNVDFEQSCKTDYRIEIEDATTPMKSTVSNLLRLEDGNLERTNPLFEGYIPEPNEDQNSNAKDSNLQDLRREMEYEEHYMIGTDDILYNMHNSTSYTIVGLDNLIESNGSFEETALCEAAYAAGEEYSDEQFDTSKRKYEDATLEGPKLRAVLRKCVKDDSSRTKLTRVELSEYLVPNR